MRLQIFENKNFIPFEMRTKAGPNGTSIISTFAIYPGLAYVIDISSK